MRLVRALRRRILTRIANERCAKRIVRASWLYTPPAPGVSPLVILSLGDNRDGTPYAYFYLYPDRMREFCAEGVKAADLCEAAQQRYEDDAKEAA